VVIARVSWLLLVVLLVAAVLLVADLVAIGMAGS